MAYLQLTGDGEIPTIDLLVDKENHLQVDFLFPNGILLPQTVDFFSPLDQIKRIIWREVHNYPLASNLMAEDAYSFVFINKLGVKEEVLDESQTVEELQPFMPLFQLVKSKGESGSKTLDKKINTLIGRGLQKQESFQPAEITNFKQKMTELCRDIAIERRSQTHLKKFQWKYPLRLRSSTHVPPEVQNKIENECIVIDVGFEHDGTNYKLKVNHMAPPQDVVKAALAKRIIVSRREEEDSQLYILKVIGLEEYIYGDHALIKFKYVYQCLVKNMAPQFWMVLKSTLPEATPPIPVRRGTQREVQPITVPETTSRNEVIVWNIETPYKICVKGISKIPAADGTKVKLYVGLYHGSESLCKERETEEMVINNGCSSTNKEIVFDIRTADLPQPARLCFALYLIGSNTKRKDLSCWVNIPVYDFKFRLQRGDRELPMWPQNLLQQLDEHCNPLGGVALNSTSMDATYIKVTFPYESNTSGYLVYPQYDKIIECASQNMEAEGSPGSPGLKVSKFHVEQLAQALQQSDGMCEQDKDLIWLLRYEVCQSFPDSLAKVLQSVKWNNYVDVAKMTALIQIWPVLPVDFALEILDHEYPDHNVRSFAVRCLNAELTDDDMSQYLLQLVQALKFETHLVCPLAEFLLTRALKNQHLGHKLFWLLRSETHNPVVSTQFSLILECYLRANNDHLLALVKQQEALKKLSALNSLIKAIEGSSINGAKRDEAKLQMQSILKQKTYQSCLSDLYSPLSPMFKMQDLKVENCKFMNSKKRPLWLVWSNADGKGQDIQLIYKNGDDLRQDMLTLQILQVMDNIWQAEGYDFRMNPYMCMATEKMQGIIEVVYPADTMANIQKWYKKTAFDKRALFEWLKDKHRTEDSLDTAVNEFLMSCAGYCVATYVLGIGDRHNDNIMMKTSGQMFHIDFGHFLGNFKSCGPVKRERVPFVLTSHFVHVITKGNTAPEKFNHFQEMCETAFRILRGKFSLIQSLFMMMLSGGIPQLSDPKDVNYLRETLVPHLSEAEALNHFRGKFKEALLGSWKTSVNFMFHIWAK